MPTSIYFESKIIKDGKFPRLLKKINMFVGGKVQAEAMADIEHEIMSGLRKRIMTNSISPKKKPLTNITKAIRRFHGHSGTQPLYESGVFAGSFMVIKQSKSASMYKSKVVAGNNLIRKGGYSRSASDLLETAENGATIPVSLKMIRFIAFVAKKYGKKQKKTNTGNGIRFIKIPARPIIKPVTDYLRSTDTVSKIAKKHLTWK